MLQEESLLLCYNRGCGKKFNPNNNKEDDCVHHPGEPVFHDAYKGWSCCNKKCTDFTEFLNIKGCTSSCHTNEKPIEAEKPVVDKSKINEVIEYVAKPINASRALKRPPFDDSQVTLTPTISPALLQQIEEFVASTTENLISNKVSIGQSCKNKSCKATYTESVSDEEICYYHPGEPIFHEGMKYWSCCKKKTTDFSAFLEQRGCTEGQHIWISQNTGKKVPCRMDWHQTGSFVVISIYAKKYLPKQSSVRLNPIHLSVDLVFSEENSTYNLDIELRGIVDVGQSSVSMVPTKVEIKLKKAEPGSWSMLDFPRLSKVQNNDNNLQDDEISTQVEAVDLSDL